MPRARKHCGIDGCKVLVASGHCEQHTHRFTNGGNTRTQDPRHREWRKAVLANARGRCEIRRPGCKVRARDADHIVPVSAGGAEFDPKNGQAACPPCHGWKSSMEGHAARWGTGTGTPRR